MDWGESKDSFNDNVFTKDIFLKKIVPAVIIIIVIIAAIIIVKDLWYNVEPITYAQINYKYPVKYLHLNSNIGKLAYIDTGRGKNTVIIIHGGGNFLKDYLKQVDILSKTQRVIALDLPGHGKSTFNPSLKYTLNIHVKAVESLIKQLKLKNVILAGHSYGAMAAIKTYLQVKKNVKKMILLAPAGLSEFNARDIDYLKGFIPSEDFSFVGYDFEKRFAKLIYKSTKYTDKRLKEYLRLIKSGDYKKTYVTRSRILSDIIPMLDEFHNYIKYINIPILLLVGENDQVVPLYRYTQRHNLPNAREFFSKFDMVNANINVKIIKKCGHMLVIEKPGLVSNLMLDFIKSSN